MISQAPFGLLRRWCTAAVAGAAILALTAAAALAATRAKRADACPLAVAGQADLGRMAFIDRGQLKLLQPATCRIRTLVASGAAAPVRWSADGRYLAYGDGSVIAVAGGTPSRPLGRLAPGWGSGSPGWVWSPSGHLLAGVTARGGVLTGGPGAATRRLLPDRWGATSIAWSPNGRTLAVSRSLYMTSPAPYHQAIWLLDLRTGSRTVLLHLTKPDVAPPWLSGFSPDGRWLLAWEDSQNSASLAADGVPLVAVPVRGGRPVRIASQELMYGDFLSWCTPNLLAYVQDNGGREVTLGDLIDVAGPPPAWPTVTPADPGARSHLSFISPACSPPGRAMIAAAAGTSTPNEPFGQEHRAIWLLPYTGGNWRALEPPPPAGSSDELPMWSADGHWIAFIRTTPKGVSATGQLYLLELGAHPGGHANLVGPIADVGATDNYYGHYGWAAQIAWNSR